MPKRLLYYPAQAPVGGEWLVDLPNATFDQAGTFPSNSHGGIFFNPDGSKLFYLTIVGRDTFTQCTLSTPWDVSSIALDKTFDIADQDTNSAAMGMAPNGVYFYQLGGDSYVYQYSTTTPYDLGGMSYDGKRLLVNNNGSSRIAVSPDGRYFYLREAGAITGQYEMSTPFDVSTGSLIATASTPEDNANRAYALSPDGSKFYMMGSGATDRVYEYDLSTPYDLNSLVYTGDSADTAFSIPRGLGFSANGHRMFVTSAFDIRQYSF